MPDWSGLTPRETAALDQFGAKFRDIQQELCASLQRTGDALTAMCTALKDFGDELQVTGFQLAIEDQEALAEHPDLLDADRHLDDWYGG
jgi:hypothetical protein